MTPSYTHSLSLLAALLLLAVAPPVTAQIDYDTNDNGLIDVDTAARLNAIRWDLNGDGALDAGTSSSDTMAYRTAFPNAMSRMGCPPSGCTGYELTGDLTLTERWATPIGADRNAGNPSAAYTATFDGQGHTITNLEIVSTSFSNFGLFANLGTSAVVRNLGLVNASITPSTPPPTTTASWPGSSPLGPASARSMPPAARSKPTLTTPTSAGGGVVAGRPAGRLLHRHGSPSTTTAPAWTSAGWSVTSMAAASPPPTPQAR